MLTFHLQMIGLQIVQRKKDNEKSSFSNKGRNYNFLILLLKTPDPNRLQHDIAVRCVYKSMVVKLSFLTYYHIRPTATMRSLNEMRPSMQLWCSVNTSV